MLFSDNAIFPMRVNASRKASEFPDLSVATPTRCTYNKCCLKGYSCKYIFFKTNDHCRKLLFHCCVKTHGLLDLSIISVSHYV